MERALRLSYNTYKAGSRVYSTLKLSYNNTEFHFQTIVPFPALLMAYKADIVYFAPKSHMVIIPI